MVKKLKFCTLCSGVGIMVRIMLIFGVLIGCSARKKGRSVQAEKIKNNASSILASPSVQLGTIETNPAYKGEGRAAQAVIAVGRAQLLEAGEQAAYERAKEHALRNAVEQVLGAQLLGQTQVEDGTLISDSIYAESKGFIEKYQVLAENNENSTKYVRLRAWVTVDELKASVLTYRVLQQRAGFPRVAILPQVETNSAISAQVAVNRLEALVAETLLAKQILVLEQSVREEILASVDDISISSDDVASLALSAQQVQALRQQGSANIAVKFSVHPQRNDTSKQAYFKGRSLQSVTTQVQLKAYNLHTGTLIYTTSHSATQVALSAEIAAKLAAEASFKAIKIPFTVALLEYWDKKLNEGSRYEVIMLNITPPESTLIKERLNERYIEGIVHVVDRGFAAGTQTFTVVYIGKLDELTKFILAPSKIPLPLQLNEYSATRAIFVKRL